MAERASDRWLSIALSVLLHGALIATLIYGFWTYHKSQPPAPTLAIEATVVDPHSVNGATRQALQQSQPATPPPQPAPDPTPPPPEPQPAPDEPTGPPQPTPEELAQREQAQKEAADRAAAEQQHKVEQQKQEEEAQQAAAAAAATEQKRQQQKHDDEQRQAQAKAEAERKAAAQKHVEEQRLADQKRQEQQQREADERSKADREAELQRSLAAEEHSMAARSSGAMASWQAQIAARIQRAWLQPPSARPGIECVLAVTQGPGGVVVNATVGSCNGDQAVRESIEAAAYRASPLPPPPDPSLFERNLEITFRPN
jgi:colicin import membrane protein